MKTSNTEAKLIHQHKKILPLCDAQRGRAWAKCFICQFSVHIKQLLWECHSRVKTEKFSTNHDCAQHLKLLHCWLNCLTTAEKKQLMVFFFTRKKKKKNISHTCSQRFYLCILLFPCLLVNTLLEGVLTSRQGRLPAVVVGGVVCLTTQLNSIGVCITCAGMETAWKGPTAPQTCKR